MSTPHTDTPYAALDGARPFDEQPRPTRWRHVRLQRLRERIQRGEYEVDSQLVAAAMIEHLRAARDR
jgi:anti-sigma-28 factor FlgM